jgi:hypothetical protein
VRVKQTRAERKETLRSRLQAAMTEKAIEDPSKHVRLSFREVIGLKEVVACESCFRAINATDGDASKGLASYIGASTWRKWKHEYKMILTLRGDARENLQAKGATATTQRIVKAEKARFTNIMQARRFYDKWGLGGEDNEFTIMLSCLPDKPKYQEALHFLFDWLQLAGDKPPVKDCFVELNNMYTTDIIYDIFVKYASVLTGFEHDIATKDEFMFVWTTCFPNVHIRKFLAVNGKCDVCANILEREQRLKTKEDLEAINSLKFLHRTAIAETRAQYYKNRYLAHVLPQLYVSWIFDGMQQSHCSIPYRGNNKVYSDATTQHIQGVKCHGRWRKFIRTFEHVETGADLACHVWLMEVVDLIDHCERTGEPVPKVCFLQVDGGSENANKTLLALAHLLVKLGVFQEVHINRLLVGHTRTLFMMPPAVGYLAHPLRHLPTTRQTKISMPCSEKFGRLCETAPS